MNFEDIEREAAELLRKFPDWHQDDRQAQVQQILLETFGKGVNYGVEQILNRSKEMANSVFDPSSQPWRGK